MTEPVQDQPKPRRSGGPAGKSEALPYRIELWDAVDHAAVERVIARAFNATLARAIFRAARGEHPDRRITLRRGRRVIADSAS